MTNPPPSLLVVGRGGRGIRPQLRTASLLGACLLPPPPKHPNSPVSRLGCDYLFLLLLPPPPQVRKPTPGRLLVKPFCRMWSSVYYCNLHQPDFLTSSSDNTCGAATINSSHVAPYEQCAGGGFSCQKFPGACLDAAGCWDAGGRSGRQRSWFLEAAGTCRRQLHACIHRLHMYIRIPSRNAPYSSTCSLWIHACSGHRHVVACMKPLTRHCRALGACVLNASSSGIGDTSARIQPCAHPC